MAKLDQALWRNIIAYLRRKHPTICRRWFEDLEPVGLDGGVLEISTNNSVQKNYLQERCREPFTEAAQAATGALITVRFVETKPQRPSKSKNQSAASTLPQTAKGHPAPPSYRDLSTPKRDMNTLASAVSSATEDDQEQFPQTVISPDFSFDSFVTGPGNHLAYAASVAVADHPGTAYNPLFIHGGVGLGKTHLLQAICQSLLHRADSLRLCYLSCDAFVNQFLNCVQKGQMNHFRHRYRHVDLLIIDDIHFLANRERTQEEFFHTFNDLYQSNRQIVLSSDSPPTEIPKLEERLVSRFQGGFVALITKPTFETRVAILRAKATLRGLELPDDVVSYVAAKIDSNARELEGAINSIQGYAAIQERPITLQLARDVLGEPTSRSHQSQITLQQIIDLVTDYYNVKLSDIQSRRRQQSIAGPRQICMYLARRHTRFSLEEIGGYFGGRDHTTVMHAIKVVDNRLNKDIAFARQIQRLNDQISNPQPTSPA